GLSNEAIFNIVVPSTLSVAITHIGNFVRGQSAATYSVMVTNTASAPPTTGAVIVSELVPSGLTLISMSGSNWTCPPGGNTCTRSDVLAPGASYPPITVIVAVATNGTSPQVNSVFVSGGASPGTGNASDAATILPAFSDTSTGDFFFDAVDLMAQY